MDNEVIFHRVGRSIDFHVDMRVKVVVADGLIHTHIGRPLVGVSPNEIVFVTRLAFLPFNRCH